MNNQKKVVAIFDSRHASSIISAAILMSALKVDVVIDLHDDKKSLNGLNFKSDNIDTYVLTDDLDVSGVKNLSYLSRKNVGNKRRVLQLFEKYYPNRTRPIAVHLLGNYQLSKTDVERREDFKAGLVSVFGKTSIYNNVLFDSLLGPNQDLSVIQDICMKGRAIRSYLSSVSRKPNFSRLVPAKKKSKKTTQKKSGTKNKTQKSAPSKKRLEDLSVKELRKIASKKKVVNYSRMKKDELIKQLS